jgi:hypothetical protein
LRPARMSAKTVSDLRNINALRVWTLPFGT